MLTLVLKSLGDRPSTLQRQHTFHESLQAKKTTPGPLEETRSGTNTDDSKWKRQSHLPRLETGDWRSQEPIQPGPSTGRAERFTSQFRQDPRTATLPEEETYPLQHFLEFRTTPGEGASQIAPSSSQQASLSVPLDDQHRYSIDTSKIVVAPEEVGFSDKIATLTIENEEKIVVAADDPERWRAQPPALDSSGAEKIALTKEELEAFRIPRRDEVMSIGPFTPLAGGNARSRLSGSIDRHASTASTSSYFSAPEIVEGKSVFPTPRAFNHPLPPQAEEIRQGLDCGRDRVKVSKSEDSQMDWAEETLRFIGTDRDRIFTLPTNKRSDAVAAEKDITLEQEARKIVEDLAYQGNARAAFIKARWFKLEGKEQLDCYIKALSKGYLRAAYYAGRWYEQQRRKQDAVSFYRQGSDGKDPASCFVSYKLNLRDR